MSFALEFLVLGSKNAPHEGTESAMISVPLAFCELQFHVSFCVRRQPQGICCWAAQWERYKLGSRGGTPAGGSGAAPLNAARVGHPTGVSGREAERVQSTAIDLLRVVKPS